MTIGPVRFIVTPPARVLVCPTAPGRQTVQHMVIVTVNGYVKTHCGLAWPPHRAATFPPLSDVIVYPPRYCNICREQAERDGRLAPPRTASPVVFGVRPA